MARKERMSQAKKEVIGNLIEMYNIKSAKDLQDALKDLLGDTLQEMLEVELSEELGYEKYEGTKEPKRNYRNGYKTKRVKSSAGEVELQIPQDRNSEFEPKVVPKYKGLLQNSSPKKRKSESRIEKGSLFVVE